MRYEPIGRSLKRNNPSSSVTVEKLSAGMDTVAPGKLFCKTTSITVPRSCCLYWAFTARLRKDKATKSVIFMVIFFVVANGFIVQQHKKMLPLAVNKTLEKIDAHIPAKPSCYIISEGSGFITGWRNRETVPCYTSFLIGYIYSK